MQQTRKMFKKITKYFYLQGETGPAGFDGPPGQPGMIFQQSSIILYLEFDKLTN